MAGYVYLIGTPIFKWYKIGKSRTPEIRVCDLGILLPFKISVIGVWRAVDHTALEATLHQRYAGQRINGEWFEFSKEAVERLFNLLPSTARVFPSAASLDSVFAKFSNIEQDLQNGRHVRVRVQKLRGDFTDEQRQERRDAAIEKQRERKALKASQQQLFAS